MSAETLSNTLKRGTGLAIVWALVLILCGIISLALPIMAGISVAIVISILIMISGVIHLTTAAVAGSLGGYLWRTLVGIAYIVGGVWLFMHPVLGLVSFTLVLGLIFLIESVFAIISYFPMRSVGGSSWLLFDGIITFILASLVLAHWPSSSAWAIATIVGVNLILSGVSRLMAQFALRRVAGALA
ncbi:HdeD family acid-resistance protein [Acidobacterium sp. S8]|uniref:HdeD family acid-resistance protein n=1 Tax=Acidobacterium sp. S8 TaxID=1641854 RepID=UPI00131AC222|nr:DUF308 domain-containing protein [Acidobacterium sp. S8]